MKKILLLLGLLLNLIAFPQSTPTLKQVLSAGNNANAKKITNIANGTSGQDAITLSQLNDSLVNINSALSDSVTQLGDVLSRLNTLPGSPTTGNRYLVGTAPTAGHANEIAEWNGSSYDYTVPVLNNTVYVLNTFYTYKYNGTDWILASAQAIKQKGNSFISDMIVGTNNDEDVKIKRNNIVQLVFGNASTTFTNPIDIPATYIAGGYSVTVTGVTSISGTNTGDQTITLTGDVTGTGTGSFTTTLANTTVTPGTYSLTTVTVNSKGLITLISTGTVSAGSSSGICGISNSSGVYNYYSTLTLAITAASSGQDIEIFADITEAGAVTITLKDGVNIHGNGHTYNLTNVTGISAFKVANSANFTASILDLNVITASGLYALEYGTSTTGVSNLSGSTWKTTTSSYAIFAPSGTFTCYYANTMAPSGYGIITGGGNWYYGNFNGDHAVHANGGGNFYFCNAIGTTDAFRVSSGGYISNCAGNSPSGYGLYITGGAVSNSTGTSVSSFGAYITSGSGTGVTGRSTSSYGIVGDGSGVLTNVIAISSSGWAGYFDGTWTIRNITAISETNACIRILSATVKIFGGNLSSNYNNAVGYGIQGSSSFTAGTIYGVTIKLSNSSAPYIYNGGTAASLKMSKCTFIDGAVSNSNITSTMYGIVTLSGGTSVVSTADVTAVSRIKLSGQSLGTITVPVAYDVSTRTAGTSFTILSGNLADTSVVAWEIEEGHN